MTTFHRPPRLREVAEPLEVSFPSPPALPRQHRRASLGQVLLVALLPSLLPPAILAAVMAGVGASSQTIIMSAALGGSLGLAVTVTTLLSRRDETLRIEAEQREYESQRAQFEAAVAAAIATGEAAIAREARVLARVFPPPATLLEATGALTATTWERRPGDPDFLELRLGPGTRRTCVRFRDGGAGPGQEPLVLAAHERLTNHASAPVSIGLAGGVTAGVFGPRRPVDGLLGWLVFQAAALHAPSELGIAVFSRDEGLCAWAKWLPHCRIETPGGSTPLVGRRGFEAARSLSAIANHLRERGEGATGRSYLVFADEREWESLDVHLGRRLPAGVKEISVVRIRERYEELDGECAMVIDLSGERGRLLRKVEGGEPPSFVPDQLRPAEAIGPAVAVAPVRDEGSAASTAIPGSARLADLLGDAITGAAAVTATWARTRDAFRLAAPIGIGPGGKAVEIDLRKDGPHGLIAGTTGSGKSEFLQSLVVSLAAKIPPDLLNFLLFDYKGGAAFAEIEPLPHVAGIITDLDERLADRALVSLRAELKRRERLFADERAVNIGEYQAQPRRVPLANLVIIIDEFHRLVSEQPQFIDQMVQIAQQGRAFGVHLLLSTQKPSGVVNDHIRANTALRICLRVTDEADSRDVLGSPEAAYIPRDLPGRGYIRVGTEPLRPCQAARVSGMVPKRLVETLEAELFLPPARPILRRANGLDAWVVPTSPDPVDDDTYPPVTLVDERARLVAAIREAALAAGLPEQTPPWQPHLPSELPLEALDALPGPRNGLRIGLLDAPEEQRQEPFTVALDGGHVLVAGAANTGKTTALLTIAGAAARALPPDRLHVYGIDFGGGALAPLDALPHSGGVAPQHDHPRVRWVIQALKDLLDERVHARSLRPGAGGWPVVLVLIDNYPAFAAAISEGEGGESALDDLLEVMDVGRSMGIAFAVTVERPEALRTNVLAMLSTRLLLPLTGAEGYSALGLPRTAPKGEPIAGRALVPGHAVHEVQIAIDAHSAAWDHRPPAPVPGGPLRIAPLPPAIPVGALRALATGEERPGALLLGLREGTRPLFWFPRADHLLVIGPRQSGRSNTLGVAIDEAVRAGSEAWAINPRRSPALKVVADGCRVYAASAPEIEAAWPALAAEIEERFRRFGAGESDFPPLVVAIDDLDTLELPFDAIATLERAVLRGSDIGVTIHAAANSLALRSTYPSGLVKALLNLRCGLLLCPQALEDFDLLSVRGRPARTGPGRGFWCEGGAKHAIQVALADSEKTDA